MSEVLVKKELAARPRELGAVACAGCPFAELGCPKQGTGDCPPPEVIEAKQAAPLLEDDWYDAVWASNDGYQGIINKPKEMVVKPSLAPITVNAPAKKTERPKQIIKPRPPVVRQKGQSVGEFAAALLLPA